MRQVITMLVLMSLTLSAEVNVYNGPYKGWSKAATLTGDSFNYIVKPQKQECEPLWGKDKNTIYQTIFITLDDKAMLDVLSHQSPDSSMGLRVISKPMMEKYDPDATWQSLYKFTMFYLFDSIEDCKAALPTIKKEAVGIKEKAKELSAKMREESDRTLEENKELIEQYRKKRDD